MAYQLDTLSCLFNNLAPSLTLQTTGTAGSVGPEVISAG